MIESLMCIGSLCEGHEFAKDLGIRVKGPVDNLAGWGFSSIVDLFNGNFARTVQEKKFIPIKLDNEGRTNVVPVGYQICNYTMIHNDLSKKETYKELAERVVIFEDYLIRSRTNENMYYLYTISDKDVNIDISEIQSVLNNIPAHVRNKIITLHTWFHVPEFEYFFPSIVYNSRRDFWDSLGSGRSQENFDRLNNSLK